MRFLQNAVLAALKRVQLFLDEYVAVLAALIDLTSARKRLDAVVASFADHAYNQDAGARGAKGETAKQEQIRLKLRGQQMDPIALIARKNLRTTPEFVALQMPKPSVIGQAFIASAKAMAASHSSCRPSSGKVLPSEDDALPVAATPDGRSGSSQRGGMLNER